MGGVRERIVLFLRIEVAVKKVIDKETNREGNRVGKGEREMIFPVDREREN